MLEAAKSDATGKICRAYTAYLDAGAGEAKGLAPIEPWLTKVRSVDKAGLAGLIAEADRNGVSHFFGGYVGQDDKNLDVYISSFYQDGLGMHVRVFYRQISAERRVGKGCCRQCRSQWWQINKKQKIKYKHQNIK